MTFAPLIYSFLDIPWHEEHGHQEAAGPEKVTSALKKHDTAFGSWVMNKDHLKRRETASSRGCQQEVEEDAYTQKVWFD